MKIISWNVNGIRAWYKKGNLDWVKRETLDIFCIQETKSHPEQLPEDLLSVQGYYAYFSSSQVKKGYSGVAIYTKTKPDNVEYGMGVEEFDQEGRFLAVYFGKNVLINCYFPNGGMGPHRLKYKMEFYETFLKHINKLRKNGYSVIFCGDVNTAHKEIDLARPKENEKNTGFLPEERAWIDEVIKNKYVDIFRHLNPNKINTYSYWDMKTRARDRNVGWRIDYFFVSDDLVSQVKNVDILDEILGSDHAPIFLDINI
ncbi:exodeoxyribonuclease III [Candidatus Campbellbacteria bacterium RIFCSPLOWO2_01_FULL_34_15]|uniref:Exodeoxyribonuclease III n=2 Tax=Candidatus Campbelliibacteriota TaxID=1752727 RepID=A0A1F5ELF6_9BACT|nr:MAG: exodeoxyribonuclease III [Candidatus Campbellbacteria bacterium RIFCSPLOWO2_01_FULL_34_15]OGD68728.1 MAG: exodeoxyribonuclease III [Candidatus Campbellbacteria bacterium RIFCSPHIGHO2_01_FULL_34_10]